MSESSFGRTLLLRKAASGSRGLIEEFRNKVLGLLAKSAPVELSLLSLAKSLPDGCRGYGVTTLG